MKRVPLYVGSALLLALTGCVNTEQTLVKGEHVINCNAVGWGFIGAPLSYAAYRHCVDFYTAQGYIDPAAALARINADKGTATP